ncbi:unnamed protein product [Polarella glacialis]|uniref:Peptidase S59 domain-containing protein n=1 Tax=Polarella glacialis TaxID=89957 RepID=A0A813F5N0_POLGL|nr:unnamed protein product [Polarella glacialis]
MTGGSGSDRQSIEAVATAINWIGYWGQADFEAQLPGDALSWAGDEVRHYVASGGRNLPQQQAEVRFKLLEVMRLRAIILISGRLELLGMLRRLALGFKMGDTAGTGSARTASAVQAGTSPATSALSRALSKNSTAPTQQPNSPGVEARQTRPSGATGALPQERSRAARSPVSHAATLRAVSACADTVSLEDLLELGALTRPHASVREVVESALMLLGFRDATWGSARARFEQPESFLEKLLAFDASRDISRLQYQKLRRSLDSQRSGFNDGTAETRCPACAGLERWCRAVGDMLAARYGDAPVAAPSGRKAASIASPAGSGCRGLQSGAGDSAVAPPQPESKAPLLDFPEDQISGLPPSRPEALAGIIITPDIYSLTPNELRQVRDLTIQKPKVGEVTFHGEIDLVRERRILEELPSIVRLDPGEVVLYQDGATKPKEGEGLNRPATITLFNCMPPNSAPFPDAESKARYRNRIALMTESKGARFVDYDCDHGIWQFRVEHF